MTKYIMEFQVNTAYRHIGQIIEVDALGTAVALERDRLAKVVEGRQQFIEDIMNSGYAEFVERIY